MAAQADARQQLAELMEQRRTELDLRWEDVSREGGVSLRAIADVRQGRRETRPRTLRRIDAGLRWAPGSAERFLDRGAEPVPLPGNAPAGPEAGEDPDLERLAWLWHGLSDGQRRMVLATAEAAADGPDAVRYGT